MDNISSFLLGVVFTAVIQFAANLARDKIERNQSRIDKYHFISLEKRFEAHQQAFSLSQDIRNNIAYSQQDVDKTIPIAEKIHAFYGDFGFYLSPSVREKFQKVESLYFQYPLLMTAWQEAPNTEEKDKASKDLKAAFYEIMSLGKNIEDYIDLTFWSK